MASFKMDDRRGFANRVCRKFDKFWQYKLPCPVDPFEDIYRNAYTDKEWAALRYLQVKKGGALKREKSFNMYWAPDCYVTFAFPKGVKLPTWGLQLDDLPDDVQRRVRVWITSVQRFRLLRKALRDRVNGVMGNPTGNGKRFDNRPYSRLDPKVNTPKQLYRAWPELQPMFLPEWKRDVQLQSVKSPLPSHVGYQVLRPNEHGDLKTRWATIPEFRAEDVHATEDEKREFREINDIILMVSLAGDVPNVESYPSFSGGID